MSDLRFLYCSGPPVFVQADVPVEVLHGNAGRLELSSHMRLEDAQIRPWLRLNPRMAETPP